MRYERLHGRISLHKITTYVASCRHASENLTDVATINKIHCADDISECRLNL